MKNLFPILALLLLVGCTSELDRCIEVNIDIPKDLEIKINSGFDIREFDLVYVFKDEFYSCLKNSPKSISYSKSISEIRSAKNANEVRGITQSESERYEMQQENTEAEYYSDLKKVWNFCTNVYERKARKICNAQGIY